MILKAVACCLVSAVAGGFVGAALAVYCMERWRQKWEDELEDFNMEEMEGDGGSEQ